MFKAKVKKKKNPDLELSPKFNRAVRLRDYSALTYDGRQSLSPKGLDVRY